MAFPPSPLFLDPPHWNQQIDRADAQLEAAKDPRPASSMAEKARMAKIPQPEAALKCPRCESTNTKFCYFNNYSLTQPRHFCKTCRRYWTRGGALRSIPVGGGCRRNKRSTKTASSKLAASVPPPHSSTSTGAFHSPQPSFISPWHSLPDYNLAGIHHQFSFLGGLAEPSPPPFESPIVKMEDRSPAGINFPRQFFNMGRNELEIWPGGGEGRRWMNPQHLSGFSTSTGNML